MLVVDPGILTFVNHGCNGTNNIDPIINITETSDDFDSIRLAVEGSDDWSIYDPALDTTQHVGVVIASRNVITGDEILGNYLFYYTDGSEEAVNGYVLYLRGLCMGDVGFVEKYQHGDSADFFTALTMTTPESPSNESATTTTSPTSSICQQQNKDGEL